jgi:UDP-N-acetyl-D-mannosaminuronate dehydrogenase
MPAYVASRVIRLLNQHRKPVNGSRILLLGVTYKADVADDRVSPSVPLARRLLELGAELSYHDPYVTTWTVNEQQVPRAKDPVETAAGESDLVIVLQAHSAYDLTAVADAAPLLFDTRGHASGDNVERL